MFSDFFSEIKILPLKDCDWRWANWANWAKGKLGFYMFSVKLQSVSELVLYIIYNKKIFFYYILYIATEMYIH